MSEGFTHKTKQHNYFLKSFWDWLISFHYMRFVSHCIRNVTLQNGNRLVWIHALVWVVVTTGIRLFFVGQSQVAIKSKIDPQITLRCLVCPHLLWSAPPIDSSRQVGLTAHNDVYLDISGFILTAMVRSWMGSCALSIVGSKFIELAFVGSVSTQIAIVR